MSVPPAWMGKAWATEFLRNKFISDEITDEEALMAIEKALLLDPDLPEAHAIMGLIVSSKSKEKAITHYEKAIELNPNFADVYSWLANSTQDQKKIFELLKQSVKLNPMSFVGNHNYSVGLAATGKFEEAEAIVAHMMSIDASHIYTFLAYRSIGLAQGNYGEVAFNYLKRHTLSPLGIGTRGYAAERIFFTIGLGEQAAVMIEGSMFDSFKYKFRGNDKLFLSEFRADFPRSDKDSFGAYLRGQHEYVYGNDKEAVKYWQLSTHNRTHESKIFSYLQAGDTEVALTLLKERKEKYLKQVKAGTQFFENLAIEWEGFIIATLEGDIEKAIELLKKAIHKGVIMKPYDVQTRLYDKIRAHPQWPDLFAKSEKRAKEQREVYLKLVAEQAKIAQ